ncbi:MAG: ferric reductase-like transmembrane domain-containing protein [Nocardiaceae bacterium]|nr:ferric reductase-like transmembrane domain-containing protein [Nocardiaceae bacterium]
MNDSASIDAKIRWFCVSALWTAMAATAYWWAADGGIIEMGTWAGWATSTGRLTGLLSSVLLLAQVLMIARIPWVERAFGQDNLVASHRILGMSSISLLIAHIVLITLGYAGGEIGRVIGEFVDLTLTYPAMLLAVAGAAALLMVAVTSARAARRRMRYESWHLLHLYAYLGAGLALPHQLWTGQEFLSSPGITAAWWAVWGLAAAAVLIWRVAVPLWKSLRHSVKVSHVVNESPGVTSVYLTGRRLDRLDVDAGQFFTWRFLSGPGWSRGKPYSLSAAPTADTLRIGVKAVGPASAGVANLKPGTRVVFEGPFGRLTERVRTQRKVALIGAGVGMTPLRALAESLPYGEGEAVIVQRYSEHPLFVTEFVELAKQRGLGLVWLPGQRRWAGSMFGAYVDQHDDDAAALRRLIPDIAERDVYLCGPPAWTDSVKGALAAAGVPGANVHIESFELVRS